MSSQEFFPQRSTSHPMIYAYSENNPKYDGLLKIGYTERDVEHRVAQQYPTKRPDGLVPYEIVLAESAMRNDGSSFSDHDIHKVLEKKKVLRAGGEWFRCSVEDVKAAIIAVKTRSENEENRTENFLMRPEQKEAVEKTIEYFTDMKRDAPERSAKFLWNAKMRFGKTFAAYQLAKQMNMQRVLVLTFKPAVEAAWDEDLKTHVDFEGWQFICRGGLNYEDADPSKPIVCFGSFQDYLGTNENGGIKPKNEWVHTTNWDIVIFDEYHFGAWRENAKKLFEQEDEEISVEFDIEEYKEKEADNAYNESFLPITSSYYLYLSGTPFRAINSGEFIEEQIYCWTYSDEQRAKENWGDAPDNPYAALPRMVMMTYQIPDSIREVASKGEFNEFDLNVFFSAEGTGKNAKFIYENEVQKWLDLIRGAHLPSSVDDMKIGKDKRPPMPYADTRLLNILSHTVWFLPYVASCHAMKNLLKQKQNTFFHDYEINVCAGSRAGIGVNALDPVLRSMGDPLTSKSITLTCGKLTTGVTVKPWTGIFMLRNLKSPETYFQAAFRVQSPWEITTGAGTKEIMKYECYVFDFALDRALRQISDYSCRLDANEGNPEKKVAEFIHFLPVLAYDGSSMKQIDAAAILEITITGTSATLLAKRWESALLVNVDNETLSRLINNKEALAALMRIEGFRSLNSDIETIINKSEAVKKVKKEREERLSPKEKTELSEEEKKYKSLRKDIQEKLIKFATRIPIFMYLTDFREHSLKDVITQLEPGLFKKVTGLEVNEFELLVSLGVFNGPLMNDAVYKFKRYEDSSLSYTGINKHADDEKVGYWDTVVSREEHMARMLSGSMQVPQFEEEDLPDFEEAIEDVVDEDDPDEEGVMRNNAVRPVREERPRPIEPGRATSRLKYSFEAPGKQLKPVAENHSEDVEKGNQELAEKIKSVSVGTCVFHQRFGAGKVIELEGQYVLVKFEQGEKRFLYPEAFEKGLMRIGG